MNTQPKKHIIIYSHGFGVRKDDLGLLSNIADAIPEVESILFDYFSVDETNKTLTICTISEQAKTLNDVVRKTQEDNPGAVIDLICHSQGTVVAAMAKPEGIRKTILLSPVFDMSLEHSLKRYALKKDAEINLDGISKLPPTPDGLVRIIPAEYWAERKNIKPFEEYNEFAEKTEIIAIEANQDTIVPKCDTKDLSSKIKLVSIDGDHNFNGEARAGLIEAIRNYIV